MSWWRLASLISKTGCICQRLLFEVADVTSPPGLVVYKCILPISNSIPRIQSSRPQDPLPFQGAFLKREVSTKTIPCQSPKDFLLSAIRKYLRKSKGITVRSLSEVNVRRIPPPSLKEACIRMMEKVGSERGWTPPAIYRRAPELKQVRNQIWRVTYM